MISKEHNDWKRWRDSKLPRERGEWAAHLDLSG